MWLERKWQSQDLNPDSSAFATSPLSIQQLREVLQGAHWYDHYCYSCFSLSSSFLYKFCYHYLFFNIQYKNIQCQLMFLYSNGFHIYLWVSLHDPCSLDSSEGEQLLPKAHSHPLLISPLHFLLLTSSSCSLVTSINIYFKLSFQRYTGDSGLALADGLRGQLS